VRRRLHRTERVEQLLDVAEQVFADHGYDATSIEQIARAAGVSRPVIYEHFGSKDGIYLACVRRARQWLEADLMEAVVQTDDFSRQLERGLDAAFAFIERNPRRWAVLFNGVARSGAVATEVTRLRFATVSAIADLIEAAGPDMARQEAEAFAHALSGAAEQLEHWWRQHPEIPRQQIVAYLHRFAWQGLGQLERVGGAHGD
jgi:AcrR family transcriptional regulator